MDPRLSHLLGAPHRAGAHDLAADGALDCAGAVAEGLRALGMPAAATDLLRALEEGADWPEVLETEIQVGDVALSPGRMGEPHVSLVASLGPPVILFSSALRVGAYSVPRSRMAGPLTFYRAPSRAAAQ